MKSKWVATALVASLAINLALAGFIIGARNKHAGGFDPTRDYIHWARNLPETRKSELRPLIRGHFSSMRPHFESIRDGHRNLRTSISAQPYSAKTLQQALQQLRTEHQEAQNLRHASFALFVESLTSAERAALAKDLGKHRRPHRDRKRPRMEDHTIHKNE